MSANFSLASSQRILLATPSVLMNVSGATLMMWIRPAIAVINSGLMGYAIGPPPAVNSSPRCWLQINSSGQLLLSARSTDGDTTRTFTGSAVLSANTWTHVAATVAYGTSFGQTFINGVLDNSGPFSGTFAAAVTANTVSKAGAIVGNPYGDAPQFNGMVEDARCYGRVVGIPEIQTIYSARGVDGIVFGLESRYPLVERANGLAVVQASNIGTQGPSGTPVNGVPYGDTFTRQRRKVSNAQG